MALLDGKVVAITGAGRGIGRGEALLYAKHGAKVIVNDLGAGPDGSGEARSEVAEKVVAEIKAAGGDAAAHADDISTIAGGESLIQKAVNAFGRLDILVNNAGILRDRMIFNMSEAEWDGVVKVHMKGTFSCTRAACAYWRDQQKAGNAVQGRIINTTSGAGLFGNSGQANYSAAKAGIAAFTITVALDMMRYGVTCNAIAPTAGTRLIGTVLKNLQISETPDEPEQFEALHPHNIAPVVVYLGSPDAGWITGQVFEISGGQLRVVKPWHYAGQVKKDDRWSVEELGFAMRRIFGTVPLGAAATVNPDM